MHQAFPTLAHQQAETEQFGCRASPLKLSQFVDSRHIGLQVLGNVGVEDFLPFPNLTFGPFCADASIVVVYNGLRYVLEAQPPADGLDTVGPVAGNEKVLVVGMSLEDLAPIE